jgi:hypothetical protein
LTWCFIPHIGLCSDADEAGDPVGAAAVAAGKLLADCPRVLDPEPPPREAVDFTLTIDSAGERFPPPEPAAVVTAGARLLKGSGATALEKAVWVRLTVHSHPALGARQQPIPRELTACQAQGSWRSPVTTGTSTRA